MKEIVSSVVARYGSFNISYSVVLFGDKVKEHVRFTNSFPDDKSLQEFIKNAPQSFTIMGSKLDVALDKVRALLLSSPRPQAKKVTIKAFCLFTRFSLVNLYSSSGINILKN